MTSRRPGFAETGAETPSRFTRRTSSSLARAIDLSAHKREYGFDNRGLQFDGIGRASDDWRVAIAPLRRYPIQRIRAGQFADAGALWQADMEIGE